MCVAELNVSLSPCRHRWYHLVRPCTPSANLSSCGDKLALSGWEIKCDFCPYCAGWSLTSSEYRLVGNDRMPSVGGLSRSPSLSMSLATTRRESRRSSLARTDSSTSFTMLAAQEKNRALSARVDAYLGTTPEQMSVLEWQADDENGGVEIAPGGSDSNESEQASSVRSEPKEPGLLGKSWTKGKTFGRKLFVTQNVLS